MVKIGKFALTLRYGVANIIANIRKFFAQQKYIIINNKRKDIYSINIIIIELMESASYIQNPHSMELQNSER